MELTARLKQSPPAEAWRNDTRRPLNLEIDAWEPAKSTASVIVRNLSVSGVLIETGLRLSTGDVVELELPVAGTSPATVVWSSHHLYGCKFVDPISSGAVSAALLRSPFDQAVEVRPEPVAAPSGHAEPDADPVEARLSTGAKFWINFGLATASWGVLGGSAWLFMHLAPLIG